MTEQKLDIFRVLAAADGKKREFFDALTEDEVKGFQPLLAMRWMSGTSDPIQIVMLNEVVNPYVFALHSHKQLLWQLLTVANSGKKQRYSWLKVASKFDPNKPLATKAVADYLRCSMSEAADALRLLSNEDVIELVEELGWQKDELAKVKKELK